MIAALRQRLRRASKVRKEPLYSLGWRTHVGKVRTVNEDRILAQPDLSVLAVADGMGGHGFGDRAASMAVAALEDWASKGSASSAGLCSAIQLANREINETFSGKSGSTLAGLWLGEDIAMVFWVGDSRVYRARNGNIELVTHDHSYVQELVDAGVLDMAAAANHPRANLITRAVGIGAEVELDTRVLDVRPGDTFLICSDGLSSHIPPGLIETGCAMPIEAGLDFFIQAALAAGGQDNISAILARFH